MQEQDILSFISMANYSPGLSWDPIASHTESLIFEFLATGQLHDVSRGMWRSAHKSWAYADFY
jgi:hypothetical protein